MGKKDEPIFSETRLIVFCSGAAINNRQSDLNANPTSPLILDKSASERLISFYKNGETFPLISKEEGRLFKAIFLGEKNILNSELNSLKGRIKIIGSEKDRVIPIEGMERNLGWVDEDLKLGIHEYPFSVRSLDNPNLEREMAGSCNVGEEFQGVFKRFVDCVIKKLKD